MNKLIVFYDGECGLCQRSVQAILKLDKKHILHFAPLQGLTAKKYIVADKLLDLNTLYFYKNDKLYSKAKAVSEILKAVNSPLWRVMALFPIKLSDKVYDFIAQRRQRGKNNFCSLSNQDQFLE